MVTRQNRGAGRWAAWGLLLLVLMFARPLLAWKMEAGTLSLSGTSGMNALQTHGFAQVYDTPPVVIILTEDRGSDPSAVRITNVTTTGFQASPVEPNSEDGPHASMTVSYLAIEPGTHTLPDGTVIEAGVVVTDKQQYNGKEASKSAKPGWEKHKLAQKFKKPILLTQLQTTNNEPGIAPKKPSHPWMTVAVNQVKDDEIEVAIERSEVYDTKSGKNFVFNALSSPESIGYVVLDSDIQSSFDAVGGVAVLFETILKKNLVDGWDDKCDAVSFKGSYSATPIVLASQSSRSEKDGGWFRECSRNSTTISLTIDEDQKQDNERKHKKEDASILVFSRSFFFDSNVKPVATSDFLMLEADTVTLDPTSFTTVSFRQEYEAPPAVFVLGDNGNPEPTSVRIRNVTTTGFEVVPVEMQSKVADATDKTTTIHYLAITYGQFQFPDGTRIEVASLPMANYVAKFISGSSWLPFNFKSGFSATPAVLGQIQTMNNESGHTPGQPSTPFLETAIRSVTPTGAQIALERAETSTGVISQAETVAYLAVETGAIADFFDIDGNLISAEGLRTPDNIRGTKSCYQAKFAQTYQGSPLVIGSQTSRDGGDGGWLRRCSVATNHAQIKIEEDWAKDTDNSHTTEVASLVVFSQSFAADFSQAASYHLEESAWDGTAGEVKDSGQFGLHGTAAGTAKPVPAKVCLGAGLDGNGYVQVADSDHLDILDELTVMAWINADTLPGSDLMTIVSKDTNFEFHLRPSGSVYWWWKNSTGGTRYFDTGGAKVTPGSWHHVTITYSKKNGAQKIFIDGVERAARAYANEPLAKNTSPLFIGTDLNFPSRNFVGKIDEVRVFTRALSASAINRYKDMTRPCQSCALGGFAIAQEDYGLACPGTRALVNVRAMCDDGVTVKDDYAGTIDLSAIPSNASSVSEFYLASTGGMPVTSYTFDGSEKGLKDFYLYHNNENDVQVVVTDSAASITSTSTDPTRYRTAALVVTTPSSLACGTSGTVTLTAVGQNPGGAGCSVLEGFEGTKSMKGWFTAATDQSTEADDATVAPLTLVDAATGHQTLAVQNKPGADNIQLQFTQGIAQPQVQYAQGGQTYVGKIKSLEFEYATAPNDGVTLPVIQSTGSSPFVFYPWSSRTRVTDANADCASADASCSAFLSAGSDFTQRVEMVCSDATPADLTDNPLASQFTTTPATPVNLDFEALAGTTCDDTPAGHNGACLATDSTPMSAPTEDLTQRYAEVGVAKLKVKAYSYFGETVPGAEVTVGRFYPDYFEVSTVDAGTLNNGCGTFTYLGQVDASLNGVITYAAQPTLRITPFNKQNEVTASYRNNFNKLQVTGVSITAPVEDGSTLGRDGVTKVPVTANVSQGTLTKDVTVGSLSAYSEYTFASSDNFIYEKVTNSKVAPFTSELNFTVTAVTDGEASANNLPLTVTPTGVELRYGRWNMEGQVGPETQPLALFGQAEYWDGSQFLRNDKDNCTNLASAIDISQDTDGDLKSIPVGGGTTDFSFNSPLSNGQGDFRFTAPGTNNTGVLDLRVDLSGLSWLRDDWYSPDDGSYDPVDHPPVRATFGVYRGHDRIIYWKEINP